MENQAATAGGTGSILARGKVKKITVERVVIRANGNKWDAAHEHAFDANEACKCGATRERLPDITTEFGLVGSVKELFKAIGRRLFQ